MGRRLHGIEGLRALAAMMIVVFHVTLYARGPGDIGRVWTHVVPHLNSGVTLFFTLSGFLLYRPFVAAALGHEPRVDVRGYLRNRALRILPGYWLALLAANVLLAALVLRDASGEVEIGRTGDAGLVLKHALLLFNFATSTAFTGIAVAWSLVVEAVFYLVLPLLGLLALRLAAGRSGPGARVAAFGPPALMLLLGVSGMLFNSTVSSDGGDPLGGANAHALLARSFWPLSALFAGGMALAVIRVEVERGRLTLPRRWYAATAAVTGVIAVLAVLARNDGLLGFHAYNLAVSVACAGLLALVVLADARNPLVRMLEWRPIAYAGLVSYGVFLWHVPLILFLSRHGLTLHGGMDTVPGNLVAVVAATLAVATVSWFAVERPALRRKRGGVPPTARDQAAVTAP
jgi:peptidoglycan/LPS O-acetylase OafA/YrhL